MHDPTSCGIVHAYACCIGLCSAPKAICSCTDLATNTNAVCSPGPRQPRYTFSTTSSNMQMRAWQGQVDGVALAAALAGLLDGAGVGPAAGLVRADEHDAVVVVEQVVRALAKARTSSSKHVCNQSAHPLTAICMLICESFARRQLPLKHASHPLHDMGSMVHAGGARWAALARHSGIC